MKTAYRFIVDHLTKVLGLLGTLFMGVIALDPATLRTAAQTYLGDQYAAKIGIALFALVMVRGWYTGVQAKQKAAELAAVKSQLPPPAPAADKPPNAG